MFSIELVTFQSRLILLRRALGTISSKVPVFGNELNSVHEITVDQRECSKNSYPSNRFDTSNFVGSFSFFVIHITASGSRTNPTTSISKTPSLCWHDCQEVFSVFNQHIGDYSHSSSHCDASS